MAVCGETHSANTATPISCTQDAGHPLPHSAPSNTGTYFWSRPYQVLQHKTDTDRLAAAVQEAVARRDPPDMGGGMRMEDLFSDRRGIPRPSRHIDRVMDLEV